MRSKRTNALIKERGEHLDNKKKNSTTFSPKARKKRKRLLAEREKASKKIEDKLLKYYERLRGSLSNGLAVVRVVRGAAEGCNIVIPPQKIAEIREKKKIVIDEHSGRILADVDMDTLDEGDKPKAAKTVSRYPLDAERKLNNTSLLLFTAKGRPYRLPFLLSYAHTHAQEWQFTPTTQKAYDLIMDLRTADAYELIPQPKTIQEHYVIGFGHAVELLISEDPKQYSDYEAHLDQVMSLKIKPNDPNELFLLAETHLQWASVYLKFGHEFDAASNLRQAYLTAQEIKKKFPNYQAIHKTAGLLEIIIGSVPEKYGWVLGLLNMEGDIDTGIAELSRCAAQTTRSHCRQVCSMPWYRDLYCSKQKLPWPTSNRSRKKIPATA